VEKIRIYLWRLFVASIPFQLGRHFWPDWSLVWGVKIDYLSPTIYLTDVLSLACFLFFSPQIFAWLKRQKSWLWLAVLTFILFNVGFSTQPAAALLKWGRIFQGLIVVLLVAANKKETKEWLRVILPIWLVGLAILTIGQFIRQGSFGGLFWWLGERRFDAATPAIAQVSLLGRLFVRPYAIFSHPNSLAGFLLVSLILFFSYPYSKTVKRLVGLLGVIGLGLTFSRTGLVAGLVVLSVALRSKKSRLWLVPVGLIVLGLVWLNSDFQLSVSRRLFLGLASLKMFASSPIWGVGLNNFISRLPDFWPLARSADLWLQPVHNVYLLVQKGAKKQDSNLRLGFTGDWPDGIVRSLLVDFASKLFINEFSFWPSRCLKGYLPIP